MSLKLFIQCFQLEGYSQKWMINAKQSIVNDAALVKWWWMCVDKKYFLESVLKYLEITRTVLQLVISFNINVSLTNKFVSTTWQLITIVSSVMAIINNFQSISITSIWTAGISTVAYHSRWEEGHFVWSYHRRRRGPTPQYWPHHSRQSSSHCLTQHQCHVSWCSCTPSYCWSAPASLHTVHTLL